MKYFMISIDQDLLSFSDCSVLLVNSLLSQVMPQTQLTTVSSFIIRLAAKYINPRTRFIQYE